MVPASKSLARCCRQVALLLALLPALAWGLSSDRSQPINIEADRATLNEEEEISVYEGNVLLRQGSLRLQGSRMTVHLSDKQLTRVILTGEPASYTQRFDDGEADQQAEAGLIEYHAGEQRLILQEGARIWREKSEEFRSDHIVINLDDNTLSAGSDSPDGRVSITLQPESLKTGEQEPAE